MTKLTTPQTEALATIVAAGWSGTRHVDHRSGEALLRRHLATRRNVGMPSFPHWVYRATPLGRIKRQRGA